MSSKYPSPENAPGLPDAAQSNDADLGIEELLREVGARDEPGEQLTHAVRGAVHAEWRAVVQRRSRRRVLGVALAAGVAGLAAATVVLRVLQPEPQRVANVVTLEGQPQIDFDGARHLVKAGEVLWTGASLQTEDARVALQVGSRGTLSLRVDAHSRVLFKAPGVIELQGGALYVDASADVPPVPLTVQTAAGTVRHVGTQYQVRTVAGRTNGIEVSIREGRVEIASTFGTNAGVAGERVAVSTTGGIERSALSAYDGSWQWATRVAPPFDIADRSLSAFLEWVARETGRELIYDSAAAQRAAAGLKLFGSIAGLDPDTALAAVLSTTRFRRLQSAEGSLRIALAS
jgi:ferric-dicitrate binding protein FerR (iron transport regulator)